MLINYLLVDLSYLSPLNPHNEYELLGLVLQGVCEETHCSVKCAGMSEIILNEPRQHGYPYLLIREKDPLPCVDLFQWKFYNPLHFPLAGVQADPDGSPTENFPLICE